MRCPNCGGDRLALAALPGERPEHLRVCLSCAHLWRAEEEDRIGSALPSTGGRSDADPP